MATNISVVVHHPYPSFRWQIQLDNDDPDAPEDNWLDILTVFPDATGTDTHTLTLNTVDESQQGYVRCVIGNPAGPNAVISETCYLSVGPLEWTVDLIGETKTIEATPDPNQTIWVRPIADVGDGGDGSSYDNAIGGWENLDWGTITAGDTIAIAGSFVGEATDSTASNDLMLVHNVSGVTIDGGLNPADPARIWGVYEDKRTGAIQPNAWALDQDGVYSQTVTNHVLASANGVYTEIELVEPNNFTRLELMASLADARAFTPTAQSAGVEGRGCYFIQDSTVYVKMPDSADPATRPIYSTSTVRGYKIGDLTTTNKTFKRITQYAAEFRSKTSVAEEDMYSSLTLDTVTFDRIWCGTAINDGFISIMGSRGVGNVHDLTVRNCVFRRSVSAIYHESSSYVFSNILIENNEFADLSNDYSDKLWTQWYDVHAIGMQHADNVVIDGNHIHDIAGNGIDFHPFGHQPDGTLTVTNNLVEDISFYWDNNKGVVANGTGIVLEHGKSEVYTAPQKVTISSNIVRRVEKVGIAPGYRGPIDLFNNTVYESGWTTHPNASQPAGMFLDGNFNGAAEPAQEINLRMFNNYFSANRGDYSCWIALAGDVLAEKYIDLDNNYYDDRAKVRGGGNSTSINDYFDGRDNGTTWPNYWANVEGTESQIRVTSSDTNAASSDPAIDSSDVPMGLTPIVDTANATHAPTTDYNGNDRVNAPDMGAVERQTANVAQAPDWAAPGAEDLPATLDHDSANDPLVFGPYYPAGASVTHQWQEFTTIWENIAGQTSDTLTVTDTSPNVGEWVVRDLATSNGLSTASSSTTITITAESTDTAEALAVVARLKTESGDSNMDAGEERAILDFVNTCVADGNWALLDEVYCLATSEQYSLIGWKEDTLTKVKVSHGYNARGLGWQTTLDPTQSDSWLEAGVAVNDYTAGNYTTGDAFFAFMFTSGAPWTSTESQDTWPIGSVASGGGAGNDMSCRSREAVEPGSGQRGAWWKINQGTKDIGTHVGDYCVGFYPDQVITCFDNGVPNLLKEGVTWADGLGSPTATSPPSDAKMVIMGDGGRTARTHCVFMAMLGGHIDFDHVAFNTACKQLAVDLKAV